MQYAPCSQPSALSHHTTNKETIENLLDKNCLIIYRAIIFRRTENTKNKGYKKGKKKVKKLLSLIVLSLFMMTGLAWAQGTLNFDEVDDNENKLWNLPAPNTYGSGSVEVNGITWEYGESQASDIYSIDNQGLLLRRASDSYLQAIIPNGIGTFSFQYRKGYTSGADRELELIVDGQQKATTGKFGNKASTDETDVYDFSCEVNKEGSVTIKIKNIGATNTNRHAVIDNIVWTAYGTGTQDPSLIVSPSNLSGFCYTEGTGSSPIKNFNVSGMYLTENISIEVGDNFEISLSPEDGYTNELTLEHIDGQVTIQPYMFACLRVSVEVPNKVL